MIRHYYIFYLCILACLSRTSSLVGSYYYGPAGNTNESVEQATERFDRMTVRQIKHVPVDDMTPHQKKAFKEVATSYFTSEIIRPGCSNQARRRKYEVMYIKIGQMFNPPACY